MKKAYKAVESTIVTTATSINHLIGVVGTATQAANIYAGELTKAAERDVIINQRDGELELLTSEVEYLEARNPLLERLKAAKAAAATIE